VSVIICWTHATSARSMASNGHAPLALILHLEFTPSNCGDWCRLTLLRLYPPRCSCQTVLPYCQRTRHTCHPGTITGIVRLRQQITNAHCASVSVFFAVAEQDQRNMGGVGCPPRPSLHMASHTRLLATPIHPPGRRTIPDSGNEMVLSRSVLKEPDQP